MLLINYQEHFYLRIQLHNRSNRSLIFFRNRIHHTLTVWQVACAEDFGDGGCGFIERGESQVLCDTF